MTPTDFGIVVVNLSGEVHVQSGSHVAGKSERFDTSYEPHVGTKLNASGVDRPSCPSANKPVAATAPGKPAPGEGYPDSDSDSCSESDTSSDADEAPEILKSPRQETSPDIVRSWRTKAYEAISSAPENDQNTDGVQSKAKRNGIKLSLEPFHSSAPVTPSKFNFDIQTVYSPPASKSPSTPTTSWLVSPLRSPIRKCTYEDLSENENASPITLAKRVRRRVFEDGEGVNPALILAPLPQPDKARQPRKTEKCGAANKAKRPANRKTKKVTFGCGAGEGSHEAKGSQDESNASSGSRYATPPQHAAEEVGTGAVHVYPELDHAALNGNDQFTSGERKEDVSTADQSLAGPSSSIPKLTDADILVICQDTQLQADGTFHCAVFWGCDRTFTYKSALKRHLKEVHGTVRAVCDKCGVELSRNDKFTRDRHRCRVSDSQAL
ncbi:hypothetical protein D9619_012873 [Psilocybe cf. subviscida]|uniref:C2H2-type domain-containing protein n=1 Tax=Psilocybe cf. subviscida TaxID=2480587 RepID=A0A8H5F4U5_9AGAR|nr:hypothetical protein D9619_012873 [Psilocybe cf. subviscida]